jgi:polar amino acid transport system substrate-binding protein
MRRTIALVALVLFAGLAAGCGGGNDNENAGATTTAANTCGKGQLDLVNPGELTVGTDNPAYPPWFGGTPPKGSKWKISDPASGQGFESAVVYAVAKQLGFTRDQVRWIVVPFNQSFRPGAKNFDFDINQISYSPQRARAVAFSNSYYDVNQSLVALKGRPVATAKSRAALKQYKLGAPIGTTSYEYITKNIKPDKSPGVYDTLNDAISALKAKQIDGVVVDLPTAFYVTAAQLPNSVIVGQFPAVGPQEHFGMAFEKGSGLVTCVNRALATLKSDGTLAGIQKEWLSDKASAPLLN